VRSYEEIDADAERRPAFSNGTEYEIWADEWCYRCRMDRDDGCPILTVAFMGGWPAEWTRRQVKWQIGDSSGEYQAVDRCTEFVPDDEGDAGPDPDPGPQPEVPGQVDMFEVFADQAVAELSKPLAGVS
jgi:hypothetical protein